MKNYTVKIFICGVFLFIPAFVFGQGSGSSDNPPPRQADSLPGENNFVITRSSSGRIVSLNKGILTIKDKKDKEIQVGLTKATKFKVGKKTVKVDELEEKLFAEGNEIKVTYAPSAKNPNEFYAIEVRFPEQKPKDKPILTNF